MEIKVPPMVRTQVGALKDALVKAVDESMRCAIVSEGAAAMEATLAKRRTRTSRRNRSHHKQAKSMNWRTVSMARR
jgi:hypothetical protein